MTMPQLSAPARWLAPIHALLARIPEDLLLFAARVFPAAIFWQRAPTSLSCAWMPISTTLGAPSAATLVTAVKRMRFAASSRLMRPRTVPSVTPSAWARCRLLARASAVSRSMILRSSSSTW